MEDSIGHETQQLVANKSSKQLTGSLKSEELNQNYTFNRFKLLIESSWVQQESCSADVVVCKSSWTALTVPVCSWGYWFLIFVEYWSTWSQEYALIESHLWRADFISGISCPAVFHPERTALRKGKRYGQMEFKMGSSLSKLYLPFWQRRVCESHRSSFAGAFDMWTYLCCKCERLRKPGMFHANEID